METGLVSLFQPQTEQHTAVMSSQCMHFIIALVLLAQLCTVSFCSFILLLAPYPPGLSILHTFLAAVQRLFHPAFLLLFPNELSFRYYLELCSQLQVLLEFRL